MKLKIFFINIIQVKKLLRKFKIILKYYNFKIKILFENFSDAFKN
jgi:hypothetical protein